MINIQIEDNGVSLKNDTHIKRPSTFEMAVLLYECESLIKQTGEKKKNLRKIYKELKKEMENGQN